MPLKLEWIWRNVIDFIKCFYCLFFLDGFDCWTWHVFRWIFFWMISLKMGSRIYYLGRRNFCKVFNLKNGFPIPKWEKRKLAKRFWEKFWVFGISTKIIFLFQNMKKYLKWNFFFMTNFFPCSKWVFFFWIFFKMPIKMLICNLQFYLIWNWLLAKITSILKILIEIIHGKYSHFMTHKIVQ